MPTNLRKSWFEYVAKIRKKHKRKTKSEVSHRDAMKLAATTWPAEKAKILNRNKREQRKAAREAAKSKTTEEKTEE